MFSSGAPAGNKGCSDGDGDVAEFTQCGVDPGRTAVQDSGEGTSGVLEEFWRKSQPVSAEQANTWARDRFVSALLQKGKKQRRRLPTLRVRKKRKMPKNSVKPTLLSEEDEKAAHEAENNRRSRTRQR